MTLDHHQVDVVEIGLTGKTMRVVVARVHCRPQFVTVGTLKPKVSVALLRNRTEFAHASDRQLHR